MDRAFIKEAETELSNLDPLLGVLIQSQKLAPREHHTDFFAALCSSIISQQVSVAAAAAITTRFQAETEFKPEIIAMLDDEAIKTIGLSRQKVSYLKDLAKHFVDDPNVYNHLD
ncbi:hypothetical protein CYG49_02275, partial [Candidatus Saccharibacteria bacterium]